MNALLELFDFSSPDYATNLVEWGLPVFFIGMATVFAVLTIILAILSVFNLVFGRASKEKAPAPAPVVAAAPAPTASSDDAIVAVIAAAIAAAESDCAGSKFRVVSFKRK